jgi:hypothetical protein
VTGANDPFERAHLDDPYPFYERLRAQPADLIEVPERDSAAIRGFAALPVRLGRR